MGAESGLGPILGLKEADNPTLAPRSALATDEGRVARPTVSRREPGPLGWLLGHREASLTKPNQSQTYKHLLRGRGLKFHH